MDARQFLAPTAWKVMLLAAFLALSSAAPNILISGADIGLNYGFPLNFYGYGGGPPIMSEQPVPQYFNPAALAADAIIWYLAACIVARAIARR